MSAPRQSRRRPAPRPLTAAQIISQARAALWSLYQADDLRLRQLRDRLTRRR